MLKRDDEAATTLRTAIEFDKKETIKVLEALFDEVYKNDKNTSENEKKALRLKLKKLISLK